MYTFPRNRCTICPKSPLGTKLFGELRLQTLMKRDMQQAGSFTISNNGYEMQVTEHFWGSFWQGRYEEQALQLRPLD